MEDLIEEQRIHHCTINPAMKRKDLGHSVNHSPFVTRKVLGQKEVMIKKKVCFYSQVPKIVLENPDRVVCKINTI